MSTCAHRCILGFVFKLHASSMLLLSAISPRHPDLAQDNKPAPFNHATPSWWTAVQVDPVTPAQSAFAAQRAQEERCHI
eukprot:scaffold111305_cov24-Tisochrysis_lutea.AAC.1